jgi:hypothetical protein
VWARTSDWPLAVPNVPLDRFRGIGVGLIIAVIVVVLSFGSLAVSFGRSMQSQRKRRVQAKSKWSSAPSEGTDDHGTH